MNAPASPAVLTTRPLDLVTLIGRFQVFHNGHLAQVIHSLEVADRLLLFVGSSNRIRSQRNLFTYAEREGMIRSALGKALGADAGRVLIMALPDRLYDLQAWVDQTRTLTAIATAHLLRPRVGLAGFDRDASSDYLKAFPEWEFVGAGEHLGINATAVREAYLAGNCDLRQFHAILPEATIDFLDWFRDDDAYVELMEDRAEILELRRKYGMGPFQAADAVVVQDNDVLTIRRGKPPNIGALAAPGGLLNVGETLLDAAIRELFEETAIDQDGVSKRDLLAALRGYDTFDDPHRSDRYHINSQGFLFVLPPDRCHPKVTAKDDAQEGSAAFRPLAGLRNEEMFEDHGFMIARLLKQAKLSERTF